MMPAVPAVLKPDPRLQLPPDSQGVLDWDTVAVDGADACVPRGGGGAGAASATEVSVGTQELSGSLSAACVVNACCNNIQLAVRMCIAHWDPEAGYLCACRLGCDKPSTFQRRMYRQNL